MITCPNCRGFGQVPDPTVAGDQQICTRCGGVGQVAQESDEQPEVCPDCGKSELHFRRHKTGEIIRCGLLPISKSGPVDPLQLVNLPKTDLVRRVASAISSETDPTWGLMKAVLILAGEIEKMRGEIRELDSSNCGLFSGLDTACSDRYNALARKCETTSDHASQLHGYLDNLVHRVSDLENKRR